MQNMLDETDYEWMGSRDDVRQCKEGHNSWFQVVRNLRDRQNIVTQRQQETEDGLDFKLGGDDEPRDCLAVYFVVFKLYLLIAILRER